MKIEKLQKKKDNVVIVKMMFIKIKNNYKVVKPTRFRLEGFEPSVLVPKTSAFASLV